MREKLALGLTEAAEVSGVGRTTIYLALRDGSLPSVKISRRRLILVKDLRCWLESHRAPVQPLPHSQELAAARQRRAAGNAAAGAEGK